MTVPFCKLLLVGPRTWRNIDFIYILFSGKVAYAPWPRDVYIGRAGQIDRVARQGGDGVQDALYKSEGGMSRRLGKSYTT